MKKYLICLGLGKNHIKLIKLINSNYQIIGIDRVLSTQAKKFINLYFKSSIYNIVEINKIIKKIKTKKIKIESILYRSSGPTILSAELLERKFNITRISPQLRDCIYSKGFFFNFLKKNDIKGMSSNRISNHLSIKKKNYILKPDAPIYGKKNIFSFNKTKSVSKFNLCKNESHNKKVNVSNFHEGNDISTFYLIDNKKSKITLLSHIEEFNEFRNNRLYSHGLCVPPIFSDQKLIRNKEKVDKSIIKLFANFYGIASISSKITKNRTVLPYEINIGLSGDKFADHIFPYIYKNRSLYKIELNMALFKTKINMINQLNKFVGFIQKKRFLSKVNFLEKLNKIKR